MNILDFKPNLIPNNPKDGTFTKEMRTDIINKNGGYEKSYAIFKKDGCRLELGLEGGIKTRSLKSPKSIHVLDRFDSLHKLCKKLKIQLGGEFYMHGLKFNEVFRFFSNRDITTDKYKEKLTKQFKKNPKQFAIDYDNRNLKFLTKFHDGLKFWLFDAVITDRPDLVGFEARMQEMYERFDAEMLVNEEETIEALSYVILPELGSLSDEANLMKVYEEALNVGFEGLVLIHKDHGYKFGRNTLKQGTIFKLKDDSKEYDGVIVGISEGTRVKAGIPRSINELGRSVTSKKKDDREPSGKAEGFIVEFEDKGTFPVGLTGFDDAAKRDIFLNPDKFIGRHFKYTGMPPLKNYPRHAFFDSWRDEK